MLTECFILKGREMIVEGMQTKKNDSQQLSTIERRNGKRAPGSGMRSGRGEIDKRGCDKKDSRNP